MKKRQRYILFFLLLAVIFVFSGCEDEAVSWEIGSYPDKIVYIQGIDTELDLTGGIIVAIFPDESKEGKEMLPQYIENSIDFNTPGIHVVKITGGMEFPIQVIPKDYIEKEMAK